MTNFLLIADNFKILFDILVAIITIFTLLDLWINNWDCFMRFFFYSFMTLVLVPILLVFSQSYRRSYVSPFTVPIVYDYREKELTKLVKHIDGLIEKHSQIENK